MPCCSPLWQFLVRAFALIAITGGLRAETPSTDDVLGSMRRVADWQLAAPLKGHITIDAWESGVFYTGVMALGDIAPDSTYHDAMEKLGNGQQWKAKAGAYNPDNYVIGQTYLELYLQKHDPAMISPLREQFDGILARPPGEDLDLRKPGAGKDNWSWCDTLFMGPGAWARMSAATGEPKYLDFAVAKWWLTSDYLYDKAEHLFYRDSRFFDQKGPSGEKVFWSRGNGWVLAGLVRLLQFIPEGHPDRPRFLAQYREMADKVLGLQQPDGSWHPDLLNPAGPAEPEASGTGLFVYSLAWGVNRGLLDRAKFEPAALKGWTMLQSCVQPDGRLAHVQPGGDRPKEFDVNNNDSFGAGAFLLAGAEVYRLALLGSAPRLSVIVTSSLDAWREHETIEIPSTDLEDWSRDVKWEDLAVIPDRNAKIVVSQTDSPGETIGSYLLFQSDFAPKQSCRFDIVLKSGLPKPQPIARTHARAVPERLDDFAWENERTAHRMYGPALEKTGEISSGVDLWAKRSHKLLIDEWYKRGDYHQDHGDGGDFYKTGPTRGCGGLGIWKDSNLAVSKNFTTYSIRANGPIRSVFQLNYAPWKLPDGTLVSESKVISLDVGSNLNCFWSRFTVDGPSAATDLPVAVGLTRRPIEGGFTDRLGAGWMSYWSPADPGNGDLGCAVVFEPGVEAKAVDTKDNYLAVTDLPKASSSSNEVWIRYHAGGGWSKGDFSNQAAWEKYVGDFALRLRSPLKITYVPPLVFSPRL